LSSNRYGNDDRGSSLLLDDGNLGKILASRIIGSGDKLVAVAM
jgi:hypothetical protein